MDYDYILMFFILCLTDQVWKLVNSNLCIQYRTFVQHYEQF